MTSLCRQCAPLDGLCERRRITGYTVERDVGYLWARRPTLTYRMYRDPAGLQHVRRFAGDMGRLGGRIEMSATLGNLRRQHGIVRSSQVTVRVSFAHHADLLRALALVRRRYHAAGIRPVPGSWHLPDVRLSGPRTLPATIRVAAQWLRTTCGVATALTLDAGPMLAGLHTHLIQVLEDWGPFLARRDEAA